MGLFSKLFGSKGLNIPKEHLAKGAVVIDVGNADEFAGGHMEGSKKINHKLNRVKSINSKRVMNGKI